MSPRVARWGWGLVLALGAVAFLLWAGLIEGGCQVPATDHLSKEIPVRWCWEFWLNRYQTLLTGLFAIAAALVSWRGLIGQLASDEDAQLARLELNLQAMRDGTPFIQDEVIAGIGSIEANAKVWRTARTMAPNLNLLLTAETHFKGFGDRWTGEELPGDARDALDELKRGIYPLIEQAKGAAEMVRQWCDASIYRTDIPFTTIQARQAAQEGELAHIGSTVRQLFESFKELCQAAREKIDARRAALKRRKIVL